MSALEIYALNVGQADTTIIKTPNDNIIVIDAVNTRKVKEVLQQIKPEGREITRLIVTHPHSDHYSAVSALLRDFPIRQVTLPPFWYIPGTSGYHRIINRIQENQIPLHFLSGYDRHYPDGGTYPAYENQPYLELLGPPNNMLRTLHESRTLNPNHLSIIARLVYGEFNMVFAADAQMENWAHYDQEGMLDQKCDVLRAAHHGSRNGNQWERLARLSPRLVIVSSDYERGHHLPDIIGSVIFLEYDRDMGGTVALTKGTGTIKITVKDPLKRSYDVTAYREGATDSVFANPETTLPPTDWAAIVAHQLHSTGH